MNTRLIKLEKISRKSKAGKCDWKILLEVKEGGSVVYYEEQYWLRRTKDAVISGLRKTCNCTIPKQFA